MKFISFATFFHEILERVLGVGTLNILIMYCISAHIWYQDILKGGGFVLSRMCYRKTISFATFFHVILERVLRVGTNILYGFNAIHIKFLHLSGTKTYSKETCLCLVESAI
jgi:hypothetical protein